MLEPAKISVSTSSPRLWAAPMTLRTKWTTVREIVVGGLLAAVTVVASPLLRRWYNRWGATDDELAPPLPGDELVNEPKLGYARAIAIEAPPQQVWPWLAQIGQGRGGFYSFDGLENLVGCDIHSAQEILPAHQEPHVGDVVRSGQDHHICWVEPLNFVMERQMLRGLRARAEHTASVIRS